MKPVFTEAEEKLRQEVQAFVISEKRSSKERGLSSEVFIAEMYSIMEEKRWAGMFVPREYGGAGRTLVDWAILMEELAFSGAPEILRTALDMVSFIGSGLILPFGSHEAKKKFLPGMSIGNIKVSIGSTEPDTGIDVDMYTTRAVEKGDNFIVNGVKIYNESHRSDYICCILQTGHPQLPKEKKISVMMIDLKSPGVSIRPLWMMWGLRRDEVVFDNVKVPKENLIGPINEGWPVLMEAFPSEWGTLANVGLLRRDYERFVDLFKGYYYGGKITTSIPSVKHMLVELALELEIGRLLYYKTWWLREKGRPSSTIGAMAKIYTTELWIRLYGKLSEIAGRYGQLEGIEAARKWPVVRLGLPGSYEFSPSLTIGGWPTEVQRDHIAQIGLGLPKAI